MKQQADHHPRVIRRAALPISVIRPVGPNEIHCSTAPSTVHTTSASQPVDDGVDESTWPRSHEMKF